MKRLLVPYFAINKHLVNYYLLRSMSSAAAGSSSTNNVTKQNRLINEKSPYLLQHASNPVDWYPWSTEAFNKAKELNFPIFLSVGYSTCHWCHVMERESFEDTNIAKILNENFISIKVDREERPDVDKLYMSFVQAITGGGGWPMSVFLTPDLKPLTGGTYFPPQDSYGRPGFTTVLRLISDKWKQNGSELKEQSQRYAELISKSLLSKPTEHTELNGDTLLHSCFEKLSNQYDPENGGFGRAPKFPKPVNMDLLLYYYFVKKDQKALEMVRTTLNRMFEGGMYDHVGKGFHRYSVDSTWHVPHFEKMLYDQGQLLRTYANFSMLTSNEMLGVVNDIADYLMETTSHPAGGFFSAEDADSLPDKESKEKREGAFYVWTKSEIEDVLGNKPLRHNENICLDELICSAFGIIDGGNVPSVADPHGELEGKNILHLHHREKLNEIANEYKMSIDQLAQCMRDGLKFLNQHRNKRIRPHLDSKFVTSWNALAISGLCAAACAQIDESRKDILINRAKLAMEFINKYLMKNSELLHSAYLNEKNEVVQINDPILAFSSDYAFLIEALLDFYELTFDETLLISAKELQTRLDEKFWGNELNGYFLSRANDPSMFARVHDDQDGAEPSMNSVAASNLLRMSVLFGCDEYRKRAKKIFAGSSEILSSHPYALPMMSVSLHALSHPPAEIVIVGQSENKTVAEYLMNIQPRYLPMKTIALIDPNKKDGLLINQNINFKGYGDFSADKPTVFICRNFECQMPIHSVEDLANQLESL